MQGTSGNLLLPGDIERRVEKALLEQAVLTEVDVVVAPHHGSRTSSSAAFVQALRPAVAVFSAGHENRWGFPDETVLNRWRNSGACLLTTAENGAIIVESRPDASVVVVRRERYDARQPWLEAQPRIPECEPLLSNR